MSGKGSAPRPYSVDAETFASNFDAIFGKKATGCSSTAEQGSLTSSAVGSNPTTPAIYVDNETGAQVTEEWWPGDAINQEQSA